MQEMAQHTTGSMYKLMSEVMDCRSTPASITKQPIFNGQVLCQN